MPNTNFQTFHQMGNAINDVVRQATGRDNVQNIDMDFVTVAQRKRLVEEIITGNPVTFVTNIVGPLDYLIAQINPIQDLHGQDAPYPAGAGKNIWDISTYTLKDGYYVRYSSGLTNGGNQDYCATLDYIPLPSGHEGETIYSNFTVDGSTPGMAFYDTNRDYISGAKNFPTTVPTGAKYIRVTVNASDKNNDLIVTFSSDTSFAPYENICPISGFTGVDITRTGKNLFDTSESEDGTLDDAGNPVGSSVTKRTGFIRVTPNTVYTYSGKKESASNGVRVHGYDANKVGDSLSEYDESNQNFCFTFTTPSDCRYIRVTYRTGFTNVQIEKGAVITEYEPFVGNVYSITFPSEAGTVYQGTLTINKDGTGSLLVTHQMVYFDGTDDTGWSLWTPDGEGNNYFRYNDGVNFNYNADASEFKCNMFGEPVAIRGSNSNLGYRVTTINGFDFRYTIDNSLTVDDLLSFFTANPLQILIPMKETETYTVSAEAITTLVGENTIWADTGNVTLLYKNYEEVI